MAERAHPDDPGFHDHLWGLIKNPYKRLLYERYAFCNRHIANKHILDIPCGVGWGTSLLQGAASIIGVDIHPDAIEYANIHYARTNISFEIGDMKSLRFEQDTFDVILCLEGFEHVNKDVGMSFLSATRRILKDGGLIIMTCPVIPAGGSHSGNPHHLVEYHEDDFIELINEYFTCCRIEEIDAPDNPIIRFVGKNSR
ncbi:class I SAM-dependent methyltransferase [Acidihalobacter prosperus]